MIRVIIADDHHLVREGIRALLEKASGFDVVGEAEDGRDAVKLVQHLKPDVLVTDIAMPRLNGIQAVEQIRALDLPTHTVILSMYSDEILVRQALQNGARGFLLKGSFKEELLLAIQVVHRGATYLSPAVSETILSDFTYPATHSLPHPISKLTPREHEVLQLISEGHTNAEIAQFMEVSIKTVERHRTSLMAKLDVHHVVELIRVALKHRLIVFDE
ncbi:MAG: response regulator transcription factor [Chloroflexi bacterium]|nr:response regulator transcription factor [Chloroflexota bacterium]